METIFPQETGFSGFFSVGFRKNPAASANTQRVGTVVIERTYTISGGQLQPDANGDPVKIADETNTHTIDGTDVTIVTHESDTAPFKPEADVVVLGFYQSGDSGKVKVDNNLWLQRAQDSENVDDPDTTNNLFGWHQRMFKERINDTGYDPSTKSGGFSSDPNNYPSQWPVPSGQPNKDPLHPTGFNNLFFNAHRRGYVDADGDYINWKKRTSFPYFSGTPKITITREWDISSETREFNLPNETLSTRFYYYCGYGLDRDIRWCDQEIQLVRDTLVVEPSKNRAYILWRGIWDFDILAEDQYRRLEVKLET